MSDSRMREWGVSYAGRSGGHKLERWSKRRKVTDPQFGALTNPGSEYDLRSVLRVVKEWCSKQLL